MNIKSWLLAVLAAAIVQCSYGQGLNPVIPSAGVTVGTIAAQNSNAVAISGGTIKGTTIGGLTYPAADGTTNQVLSANGNGTLTFKTVAAGVSLTGYETAIAPSDWHGWMPGYGSTVSNAAAPVYWSVTDAGLNETAFGFSSDPATTTLQSRYAFATIKVPSYASGYKAGDNMVIAVKTSTTSTITNALNFSMIMPGQAAFVTNGLVGATANGLTTITIPVASLPTFTHPNGITNATLRCDFQCFAGATAAVCHVMIPWQ